MFELDGEFDLDEDFLQGVFETENEVAKEITGIQTEGEKRSPEREPFMSVKKYKSSSNDHTSTQYENGVPVEGRNKVSINNIGNSDTETSAELSNVHEVINNNLSASKTEVRLMRNDKYEQSGLKMQLDNTCSMSDNCPGRSTPAMPEPRTQMILDGKYKYYGSSTFKECVRPDVTIQQCQGGGQAVRQRKFPGPAGLLPDKDQMVNWPTTSAAVTDSEILHNENPLCFQSSGSMFEGAAWLQMLKDFELSDSSGPLSQFTVAWVKRRAAARQLLHRKVPFLVTVLRDLDCSSPDPCVVLQDRTGEVHGTLHREVWEEYGGQLQPGSVLVLRQVGVLSTGITVRRHYLNVTCNNIINIYSNVLQDETAGQRSSEVKTTRVHRVTRAELLKNICDWKACHSSPENSPVCKPVSSMFSVIGSPAHPPVPCHQSGSVTGNASCRQQAFVSVPKLVYGTEVPQAAGRVLCNRTDNTESRNYLTDSIQIRETDVDASAAVHAGTPFNGRVPEVTAQSVHGRSASSDMPQQIKKDELSSSKSFKFQPLVAHTSGRRNVLDSLHQSDEGNISGTKDFKFLPQLTVPLISDRTDMVAPKYGGGFTSKMLHFGSSSPSNPFQVSAVPSTSLDVLDLNRTLKPTEPLQRTPTPSLSLRFGGGSARTIYSSCETIPRSSECLEEAESSALKVLEGLDTSSFFDDF